MAETVGEGQIVIGADTSNLDADLQKKVTKSGEKGGGFFSTGFGKAIKVGVIGTVTAVGASAAAVFGTAMSKGFERSRAIENAEAMLKGLKFTAEDIEDVRDRALGSVSGTAYGLGEAMQSAAVMTTALQDSGDGLARSMKSIVDVSALTQSNMGEITSIWQSMGTAGKVTNQRLEQLNQRGLPVFDMLAEHLNTTPENIQKMVKNSEISLEQFEEMLEEKIGGAALEMGNTFDGAAANIGAALGRIGEMFADPIKDTLRDSFNAAIPALDEVGKLLEPLSVQFGDVLADQVLPRVISGLEALPDLLTRTSDGFSGLKSILSDGDFTEQFASAFNVEEDSPLVDVLFNIREAISDVWGAAKEFFTGFSEGFGGTGSLGESLGPILTMLQGPLGILKTVLVELFEQVDFEQLGKTFGSVFGQIADVAAELTGTLGEVASELLEGLIPVVGEVIERLLPVVMDLIEDLTPIIVEVVEVVGEFAGELLDELIPVLMDLIESVLPPVMDLIEELAPVFKEVLDAVLPLVGTILDELIPVFEMVVDAIAPVVTELVEMLVPIILDIVDEVVPPLIEVFDAVGVVLEEVVLPILSSVVDFLSRTFTSTFENLKPLIERVFGFIRRTIRNAMKAIEGIIDVVLGVISGDWDRAWEGIKKVLSSIWDQLKNIVSTAIDLVKGYITFFIEQVTDAWDNFWTSFKDVGESAWNWVRDTALGVWEYLADKTEDAFNGIKDAVEDIWNGIKKVIGTPIDAVIRFVNDGIIGGYNTIAEALNMSTLNPIPQLAGFASGGYVDLPWSSSKRDPYLGVTGLGQMFRFEGEEFIVNRERTKRNRKLLEAINAGLIDQSDLPGFRDGGIVSFRGHRFTALFASLLREAERMAGRTMRITQGGFRPRTSYSGTSHRGDAVDLAGNHRAFIPFLRKVGIAAWDRTGKGNWISHTHGVPLPGRGRALGSAIWQAQDYLRGGDGLGGRDNGPRGGMLSGMIDGLLGAFQSGFDTVAGWFNDITGGVKNLFSGLNLGAGVFGELFGGVGKKLMDGFIDWAKEKLNPFDGGEELETPARGYAGGTRHAFPGLALVGEGGRPELIDMQGGERVYNGRETENILNGRAPIIIQNLNLPGITLLSQIEALLEELNDSRRVTHMNGG